MSDKGTLVPRPDRWIGGSSERERRHFAEAAVLDLVGAAEVLRHEPIWRAGDRNAVTLAWEADVRAVLTGLEAGAVLRTCACLEPRRSRRSADGSRLASMDTRWRCRPVVFSRWRPMCRA
jgi:hypothetical protein